jgi:hypothetical protein
MAVPETIKVVGLLQFQQALKQLEADAPKALRIALKGVGNIVYQDAIPKIPVRTGRAKRSAKLRADQRRVEIRAGDDVPYWKWLDFGGWVGRGRSGRGTGSVYRKWLGKPVGNGRYFWHSFAEKQDEVQRALDMALLTVARRAGLQADFAARREFLTQDAADRRREVTGG